MINEQLYINNISVPLDKVLNIALTKSIQDIKEPNKRKATFSKSVTLPDSKIIREVFDHFFEFNMVDRSFNPLVKVPCRYEVSNEVILEGYIQLRSVEVLDEEGFAYSVSLVSQLGNFFEDIKDSKLEDLDLSEYNHILNREIQELSWDTQIIKDGSLIPFNKGEGYVYALVDYGFSSDSVTFDSVNIGTSIYVRQYFEKIFEAVGYTWESTFLDSDLFKSLIIPSSPETFNLTSAEISDRTFTANEPELDSTGTTLSNNLPNLSLSVRDKIINTVELADTGGVYDPATGVFTCIDSGVYTFELTCHINATFTPNNLTVNMQTITDVNGYLMLHKTTASSGAVAQVAASAFYITKDDPTAYAGVRSTSATPLVGDTDYLASKRWSASPTIYPSTPTAVPRTGNPPDKYKVVVTGLEMIAGDKLEASWKAGVYCPVSTGSSPVMFVDEFGNNRGGQCTLNFPLSSFYSKPENTTTYAGSTLEINKTIPTNITQTNFILAFIKMFNLFIDVDPSNPKNLTIEPRDEFLGSDVEIIHKLIDRAKPFIEKPVTDLNALKYIYKYKDDGDYFNEIYLDSWQKTYGEIQVDVTHDFGKDIQKEELMFSPTPSVSLPFSNRVLPTIQQRDEAGQPINTKHNIRVLYYGGLKDCNSAWIHQENISFGGIAFPIARTQYPYAGHFDDPYSPTLDLNFGLVNEVYYWSSPLEPITVTNNNLFNAYHSTMIKQFTDEDTRIIECYLYLDQTNWNKFDFTKLYYFGTGGNYSYHRLYKIFDFNPNSSEPTKVQFLRLADVDIFVPRFEDADGTDDPVDPATGGGGGGITIDETLPILPSTKSSDGNTGVNKTVIVTGENNYIDPTAKNVQILGDGNIISGDVEGVNLINSSNNIIDAGVKNVTLINSSGLTIVDDNVTYIDGAKTDRWTFYATEWSVEPFTVATGNGYILIQYENETIGEYFRYIPNVYDPTQDAFFSTRDGVNVFNQLAVRG